MTGRGIDRVAALSGALYFLLVLFGFALAERTIGGWPDTSDPAGAAHHLLLHRPTALTWVAMGMETVGLVLLLVFSAYVAGRIRQREGATGWMAPAVLALGAATIAVKLGSLAPAMVAIVHPDRYADSVVAALIDVNDMAFVVTMGVDGVLVLVAAGALLRYDLAPHWLAAAGVIAGLLGAGSVAIAATDGPLPIPMMLWLAWTSVVLSKRPRAATSSVGDPTELPHVETDAPEPVDRDGRSPR